jgi:hypothetical protein
MNVSRGHLKEIILPLSQSYNLKAYADVQTRTSKLHPN